MYGEGYVRFRATHADLPGGIPAPLIGGGVRTRAPVRSYNDDELVSEELAPEELARSLQPVANRFPPRRMEDEGERPRGAPPFVPSGQWRGTPPYDATGFAYPRGEVAPPSRSMLPPVKYQRVNEMEGLEDPYMLPHGGGGGGGGGAPRQYRMPVNAYDSNDGFHPPPVNARYPPQRSEGYAAYAPPPPLPLRAGGGSNTQEMMQMMRQRHQAVDDQDQDPHFSSPPLHRPPPRATWGRGELDALEHAQRIHRELQVPPPQSSWPTSMRGAPPPLGSDDSPGSRIVTPAAALHPSLRRPMVAPGGPRGPPGFDAVDPTPLPGMPRGHHLPPSQLTEYDLPEPKVRRGHEPAASSRKPRKDKSTSSKKRTAETLHAHSSSSSPPPPPPLPSAEPKRRCGRKSMNYSSEQKRERNRAAVKKCRQRQALKTDYLQRKAAVLASENRALSEMLVKHVALDEDKRHSLTRGIQMDILLKIKEIFTQSLPKDFVLDADSIWDLNSVLAVSMPSRCYYGIESIKDFWRTSLRMRNKGKIRSFWAWLFRLPPGDRFAQFTIQPFGATSNLYFIHWTTKSTPPLSGSIVILFGHGHRVTLHVEIFGWLIWRYLLTNTPFPEPNE